MYAQRQIQPRELRGTVSLGPHSVLFCSYTGTFLDPQEKLLSPVRQNKVKTGNSIWLPEAFLQLFQGIFFYYY